VIAAPTASGKTAAALALAAAFPIEVVSADAMQVYRGLDVGTAKPSHEERARVPHHVLDVVEPSEAFSVAAFVRHAEAAIADVLRRGALPLVVGGTGFYLRALDRGLPGTPPADRSRQAAIEAELADRGLDALVAELAAAAPTDAAQAGRNPRRVVRALEVLRATGQPASALPGRPPRYRYATAVLLPPHDVLADRIRARTRRLVAEGWLEEVARLAPTMSAWPTARQAIGYDVLRRHLSGELTVEEALASIDTATTRYAKRQRTWFVRTPAEALRMVGTAEARVGDLAAWLASEAARG
jgi:tRNA dimethylallyltransferase